MQGEKKYYLNQEKSNQYECIWKEFKIYNSALRNIELIETIYPYWFFLMTHLMFFIEKVVIASNQDRIKLNCFTDSFTIFCHYNT